VETTQQLARDTRLYSFFANRMDRRGRQPGRSLVDAIQEDVETDWHRRIAPAGAARYFRDPPRYRPARPNLADPYGNVNELLQAEDLLNTTAFLGPVYHLGLQRTGVQDGLSAREEPETMPYQARRGTANAIHSQADLMESRLKLERERVLREAWEWFGQKEYDRSRTAFESAEVLDRSDSEPRAGVFFCSIAEQRYIQAAYNFSRLVRWSGEGNLFRSDYRLADRYESLAQLRADIRAFAEFAASQGNHPDVLVQMCYLLWHTGNRSDAAAGARHLIQRDPTGPVGTLGRQLTEALGAEAVQEVE
jgi:hypothetical protein